MSVSSREHQQRSLATILLFKGAPQGNVPGILNCHEIDFSPS